MATPIAAAGALLARQYFTNGWYPTKAPVTANIFNPSGALLKAVLVGESCFPCPYQLCPLFDGGGHIVSNSDLVGLDGAVSGSCRKVIWLCGQRSGVQKRVANCAASATVPELPQEFRC